MQRTFEQDVAYFKRYCERYGECSIYSIEDTTITFQHNRSKELFKIILKYRDGKVIKITHRR